MTPYTHKKIRPWRLSAMALRALSRLLELWPLFVIAAVLISPIGPHMRWQYIYEQRGPHRHYLDCLYLGGGGFVRYVQPNCQCPFLIVLDRRQFQ